MCVIFTQETPPNWACRGPLQFLELIEVRENWYSKVYFMVFCPAQQNAVICGLGLNAYVHLSPFARLLEAR